MNQVKNNNPLLKKARRKYLANGIKYQLGQVLSSPLHKSYIKSFCCSRCLIQTDNRLMGIYCNQRWCPTCTAIKTAKFIDAYKHELEQHQDYYFVTLTIKSDQIYAENLKEKIGEMILAWKRINANARDKKRTGQELIWHGMRKIECTYRDNGTFHPHFHVLVRGEAVAERIITEWLNHFPTSLRSCQTMPKADAGIQHELFKYYTKLISGSSKNKKSRKVNPVALDAVLQAMIGRRVFHNFGTFKKKLDETELGTLEQQEFEIEERPMIWNWVQKNHDWIDLETGECLSGYNPSDTFTEIAYPNGSNILDFSEGEKSNHYSGRAQALLDK